ncbi:hypothetical protein EVA_22593 [gut metagenome]|uniref:Uncharacterized protein n=1 Tax=gut metagenome TaxID=749906 RepID=J9FI16_9ZZZZ
MQRCLYFSTFSLPLYFHMFLCILRLHYLSMFPLFSQF